MEERDVDFRALDYVAAYDSNLMCPICRTAFVDPVVVSDCGHHFCRDCLDQTLSWNISSTNCPACRRPARLTASASASKLLLNILDDLLVLCPNQCDKQIKRGHLRDHLNIYCPNATVKCPDNTCNHTLLRKDATTCLHQPVSCLACRQSMTCADLDSHWLAECPDHDVPCPSCAAPVPYRSRQTHLALECPEANAACPAQQFGCAFTAKRKQLSQHTATCCLARLAPHLAAQQKRQHEQEAASQLLDKKLADLQKQVAEYKPSPQHSTSHEDRTFFAPPLFDLDLPTPLPSGQDSQPYASPTQHLLSLHENLREEVSRQANTIHEVDTRLSMMLLNENMRLKDELAYQGAQLSHLTRQVGWLTNARLQVLQTPAVHHDSPGPSEPSRMLPRLPVRRTTDEGRTKL